MVIEIQKEETAINNMLNEFWMIKNMMSKKDIKS